MRYQDIYVAGTGAWYPKSVPVDEAVADGRYDLAVQRRTGQQRVTVAESETQPEMAVLAGLQARERSGVPADRFRLLLHAVATHNGLDAWNAASYVQHRVLDGQGISFEVRQLSNGAVGSLELACAYLAARTGGADRSAALITASDLFAPPAWNRWRASPLVVHADGASAMALATGTGFARVVSVASVADAGLEGMHRGGLGFSPDPQGGHPVSIGQRVVEYTEEMNVELGEVFARIADGMRRAGSQACSEAGMAAADADHVVTPHLGRELFYEQCLDPLGVDLERTTWRFGAQVGHAGSTDQFAGLNHLVEEGALDQGQRVLVASLGGGFNWTCAVLEVVDTPAA
jgi:3-oxoacyl-[acyl-carrier-protein] synthase III